MQQVSCFIEEKLQRFLKRGKLKISVMVIGNVTIRWSPYDFLLTFCSNMSLSHVVSGIFNVEKYRDLEIPLKGQSRSLKVVYNSIDWVWFTISVL